MSDLGDRLRDERKRLGMNQIDFAILGGVKKNAQMNYESGERSPDADYLCALLKAGVDIMFVLTGARATESLKPVESELIAGFRKLDERGQAGVIALIGGINPVKDSPRNVFHGDVGQVIKGNLTMESQTFSVGSGKKKPSR